MNKELLSIIKNLETTLSGQPWYGRNVYELLDEVKEDKIHIKPNDTAHSLAELLWHMNTWAEFVLAHLEKRSPDEIKTIEGQDWRDINSAIHDWQKGVNTLKTVLEKISNILSEKQDDFLNEMVPGRQFNFRFMLNGLIQHNIYHLGQVAYLSKMFG